MTVLNSVVEAIAVLDRVVGPGNAAGLENAMKVASLHLPDERTLLHSVRVAYRAVKRARQLGSVSDSFLLGLARVGLLHDVLEDSANPLLAAMEIALAVSADEAYAIMALTRKATEPDADYFNRLKDSGSWLAARVKIEDAWDNLMEALEGNVHQGVFTPARLRRFALKVALYVMPTVKELTPDLFPLMEKELKKAVS